MLRKIIEEGGNMAEKNCNVDESGLFWKECMLEITFPNLKLQCQDSKQ